MYLDLAMLLNFLVDLLLLLAVDRLCGYPTKWLRAVGASALGGVYAGACLLPGFSFLGNLLWRTVSLGLMGVVAFGWKKSVFRRTVLFGLLCMALGGVALGMQQRGFLGLVAAAGMVLLLCFAAFRGRICQRQLVPVELCYGEKKLHLTALCDTGNGLRDPVSGQQVLVVGADVARQLTGLQKDQLRSPAEQLGTLPGSRLIPYRAVGKPLGMLLAMRLQEVKIGAWRGSAIVAFAPEELGENEDYQALTGGAA